MALERAFDEFRGLSLLLQHRALVSELDAIADAVEDCQRTGTPGHEMAARLLPMLRGFTRALPEHFVTESKSTVHLLRNSSDPDFDRRLRQLDDEHPLLLQRFEVVVQELEGYPVDQAAPRALTERVLGNLALAIEAFRTHESEEDALFADEAGG